MKKIKSLFACLVLTFYVSTLWAQQGNGVAMPMLMGPNMDMGQMGQSSNSNFGGKSPVLGGQADGMRPSMLQEQGYSGLTYQVHILGEVNKPGTYRIQASTRLSEAIERAGGIQDRGSLRKIELRRGQEFGAATKVTSIDLFQFRQNGDLNDNPYLLDNDVVYVPLRGKVVQVIGTVMRPGTYELLTEKSVEDLIRFVGGFSPGVQANAPVKIIRYENNEKKIIDIENSEAARSSFFLQGSDIVVIPDFITKGTKFDYNFYSLPGGNPLSIPSYNNKVFILGAVLKPGPQDFDPYYGVRQYLTMAGGTTKLAKNRKMRVVRHDGKSIKARNDTVVNPGDTIVVPEKYLPPEGLLSLVLGLTTSVLGVTTTILTLTK